MLIALVPGSDAGSSEDAIIVDTRTVLAEPYQNQLLSRQNSVVHRTDHYVISACILYTHLIFASSVSLLALGGIV